MSQYVKFTYQRVREDIAPFDALPELNACRWKLLDLHLIGLDSNGIGFGNLTVREGASRNFYITGSATGGLLKLSLTDCVRVVDYDFKKNWVRYEGAAIPSSESLTHAAIYESELSTTAVIHCHDSVLWRTLLDGAPTTSKRVPYGTCEMAREIIRLFTETDVRSRKIFVMAGHEGGIVTLGKNFEEAFAVLLRQRKASISCVENGFHDVSLRVMRDELAPANQERSVTRRKFVGITLASGAALLAGKSDVILGAVTSTSANMATNPSFDLGGDFNVNRLGFGAMRVTGERIWGWPADRQKALKVLRRA